MRGNPRYDSSVIVAQMSGELNEQASQTASGLFFITHTVHSTVGITLMAAIVQMIAEMDRLVSRAAPMTLEDSAAAEVEEHEVAGEDAAADFVGGHLEEQVG